MGRKDTILEWTGKSRALGPLARYWVERRFLDSAHGFRGVYESFEAAREASPTGRPLGYDNPEAAAFYRERLGRVYPSDYPVLFWLGRALPLERVFDFGGHVGVAYYAYDRYLSMSSVSEWTVCDLPAVCEAGRALATERGIEALKFTSDRAGGDGVDLFFASGSLQYLEIGLPDLLRTYRQLPRRLLLNLLPVTDRETFYTVQSIGVAFCPYRIQARSTLLSGLSELGYTLEDSWENAEKSCRIPLHSSRSLDHYEGFLFTLNGAAR